MNTPSLPHTDQLFRNFACEAGVLLEGTDLPPELRTFGEAIAGYCARIGDAYDRDGMVDVTAGDHIRSEFDI